MPPFAALVTRKKRRIGVLVLFFFLQRRLRARQGEEPARAVFHLRHLRHVAEKRR